MTESKEKKPYGSRGGRPYSGNREPGQPSASRFSSGRTNPARSSRPYGKPAPVKHSDAVSPARKIAYQVLCDVHQNDAFASLALNLRLSGETIKPEDRRLATALVYGVLENELRLNTILSGLMDHLPEQPQMDLLRLGAYQVLFMDRVPDSAAVNESVNLAKTVKDASPAMINGVLRNLVRGKDSIKGPDRETDSEKWLSYQSSTPLWLVRKMISAYGAEEAEKLLLYREETHPVVIRPSLNLLSDAEFESLLSGKAWHTEKGLVPHAWKITGASSLTLDRDYAAGRFSIQGESSMLAAMAVGAKPGMKILDACAAPGGKSAYLCESMQMTGRVFAWELHEKRAALIEGVKRRLHLENLRVSCRDASVLREDLISTFDAVLLDAPCSGLGVMLQKPDIKLRLQPEDLPEITMTQRKLLETVCQYVKPGGTLVYSTCSVLPEENAGQIRAFLSGHPEYELISLPDECPEALRAKQGLDGLQLLPHRDGVEGFFIARMRRAR